MGAGGIKSMQVIGVDGCPGGWIAVTYDITARTLTPQCYSSFRAVLDAYSDADVVAVDIPIGLAVGVSRRCDDEARRTLGRPRGSSVFPAPDPRVLDEVTREGAQALLRTLTGKGISAQAFGIYAKVTEVNAVMTPELQERVVEVHPEVSFWAAAERRPMTYKKKKAEGYEERRAILARVLERPIWSREEARAVARPAAPDDVLDAIVAAWTARRVAESRAGRFPVDWERDHCGLRMEIVY
jgi:predicted RNase H-like nuclease